MSSTEIDAIDDQLLVLRAQAREDGAFKQLVTKYERRLLYYIHRILGSGTDRADVLQEVWMRVFIKINTLRSPKAFRTWLYKIAHDVAVSQLRKTKRKELLSWEFCETEVAEDKFNLTDSEMLEHAELVHTALERLSLPHREVLTLRFLEELEISEIAKVVGCGIGTVKSRLHYARSAMRSILEETCHE